MKNGSFIDIRASLHILQGYLRRNEIIDAYDLIQRMSKQMDEEYYKQPENCSHLSKAMDGTCFNCGKQHEYTDNKEKNNG